MKRKRSDEYVQHEESSSGEEEIDKNPKKKRKITIKKARIDLLQTSKPLKSSEVYNSIKSQFLKNENESKSDTLLRNVRSILSLLVSVNTIARKKLKN